MQALLPGIVGHDAEVCLPGVITADLVVQDSGVGQAGAGALLEDLDGAFFALSVFVLMTYSGGNGGKVVRSYRDDRETRIAPLDAARAQVLAGIRALL